MTLIVLSSLSMDVDSHQMPTEVLLGGDMKFMQKVLGLQSATSKYACICCHIAKDERWDME